ncbi:hypothetical protein Tco_0548318 [Tanacetum coccineum]
MYQVLAENKLQRNTYDIGSFIKWFYRRTGKKKLCKADLEGPAFNLVKAFHKNNVLEYLSDSLVMDCDKGHGKADKQRLEAFILLVYNKAWRLGNGQRMTRGGAKTSSQRSRKDYRSGGSFERVVERPCWSVVQEESHSHTLQAKQNAGRSKIALFEDRNKGLFEDSNVHIPPNWIERDEDAIDKEVKDRVKDHKRKHDSDDDEDDDDDEGPSARSNQGKSTKRRRHNSGASGSAQPPPKDSDTSASKQHPTLTSTGWQITNTRDAVIDSLMHRSEPESGHSEHSSDDVSKQDEGHVSDLEDTDNAHIPKVTAATWFKPIPEDERPWTIPSNDFPKPENNWANAYATTYQVPAENKLQRKTYDIGSGIPSDSYLREIILCRADYKEYEISEKDLKNLHQNDFEDLYLLNIQDKLNHLSKSDKIHLHTAVNMWIRNLVIRNRVGDLQLGIESYQTKLNLERPNWDATDYSFKEDYTIVPKPRAVIYRDRNDQRKLMRLNEIHKFSDGTLTRVMEKLDHMVKDFHLFEYNKGMETRKWSEDDKRRSKDFITAIEKRLQIRRIFRSLESFVGGRIRDIDYRLINRTT